jgi:hypothetical protein
MTIYEEPVYEVIIKEPNARLMPMDLETYKISNSKTGSHIDSKVISTIKASSRIREDDSSEFNIQQLLKKGSYGTSADESIKMKANSKVMEFFNEIKYVRL